MASTTAAGTGFAISAGVPAAQTVVAYEALTYTDIANVQNLGGFGPTTGVVAFQPLRGPEQKHKGPTSYGTLSPTIALDETDAGQALLAARGQLQQINLRIAIGEVHVGDHVAIGRKARGQRHGIAIGQVLHIGAVLVHDGQAPHAVGFGTAFGGVDHAGIEIARAASE